MEVEPLAAREDGLGYLVDLGGGEDEHHVSRRLLEGLQQSVPSVAREHVHLVDDIHAVLAPGGGEGDLVDYPADIVDTAVGGGVHLDDVEYLAAVDAAAVLANSAGIAVAQVEAVDGLGEDLGAGGLARSSGAGEEVGVVDAVESELVAQGIGDMALTRNVLKTRGAVFPVQHLIHQASLPSTTVKRSKNQKASRSLTAPDGIDK